MKEGKATKMEAVGVKLGIVGNSVVQEGKQVAESEQRCSGQRCLWETQTVKRRLESLVSVQLFDFHDKHVNSLRQKIFRLAYYFSYSLPFTIENYGKLVRK